MKVLELTNYSAGICGVWNRVKEESKYLLERGHQVKVFSSSFTKGSKEIAKSKETIEGVSINRFKAKKLGGESFMRWYTQEVDHEVMSYAPEIIIVHTFRHHHTTAVLGAAKKIGAKVFLVTHAPFIDENETRSYLASLAVKFYDTVIAPRTLPKFDKIIAITQWERPYLKELKIPDKKIVYIPNGVPSKFFSQKAVSSQPNKILFLGRISPIKSIETLLNSLTLTEKNVTLEIVGPAEEEYLHKLERLVGTLNLNDRVIFSGPIYNVPEKIKKIDSCSLFVLPSIREAMPQALIEAMSRGKVCIASKNKGSEDIITSGENGYLFERENARSLSEKINECLKNKKSKVEIAARKKSQSFKWEMVLKELDTLIHQ